MCIYSIAPKKQIENVVRSETKYSLLNYNWTNTNKFINETYKGNTQTIRDIVDSFNEIFEDDPENMRYSAYTFNDNDYVYMHFSDLTVSKNVKPYQKIVTIGEENIQYQMPAYFMQYIAYAMHDGFHILEHDNTDISFAFTSFTKRYSSQRKNIKENNNLIQTPHYVETYYYLTKNISIVDFY